MLADLNQFTTVDELRDFVFAALTKVSNDDRSYLKSGLNAAETLLEQQSFHTSRDHYRKMIIVYASTYQ